jgi:hypothetical protein
MKKIEFTIRRTGEITVDAQGFQGAKPAKRRPLKPCQNRLGEVDQGPPSKPETFHPHQATNKRRADEIRTAYFIIGEAGWTVSSRRRRNRRKPSPQSLAIQ